VMISVLLAATTLGLHVPTHVKLAVQVPTKAPRAAIVNVAKQPDVPSWSECMLSVDAAEQQQVCVERSFWHIDVSPAKDGIEKSWWQAKKAAGISKAEEDSMPMKDPTPRIVHPLSHGLCRRRVEEARTLIDLLRRSAHVTQEAPRWTDSPLATLSAAFGTCARRSRALLGPPVIALASSQVELAVEQFTRVAKLSNAVLATRPDEAREEEPPTRSFRRHACGWQWEYENGA